MSTLIDDLPPDEIRDAQAIARRALTLFSTISLAFGNPRDEIVSWLKEEGLWEELSPTELAFVSSQNPTQKQKINASWQSEALIVLLWALGKVNKLPAPNEQCDTSLFQKLFPVAELMASAERRDDDALMDMADELEELHWQARHAKLRGRAIPSHLNIEIIQERHHAINWIIGYDGLPWDEVATDT